MVYDTVYVFYVHLSIYGTALGSPTPLQMV